MTGVLCERCQLFQRWDGERFCTKCRGIVLRSLPRFFMPHHRRDRWSTLPHSGMTSVESNVWDSVVRALEEFR